MSKFGTSQSVRRTEDLRLLTGQGRYTDDLAPEDALHMYVLRSPVAHGRITAIDTSEASALPGVALILAADDLDGRIINSIDYSVLEDGVTRPSSSVPRPILTGDKVRFVGDPVAVVIASTLDAARDAAEAIALEIDDLPVHLTLAPGGEPIQSDAPDNVAFDWGFGDAAATDAAFAAAAHTTRIEMIDNRVISNPLEARACLATWNGTRMEVTFGGQGVWRLKGELAQKMGLEPEQVRIVNPDVGGGFGTKAFNYPEYFLAAVASKELGQPVRWMADRAETMLSDNAGRDLVTIAEAAFDTDYKLTGLRIRSTANMGAYPSTYAQFIQTDLALKVLTGVYDVQAVRFEVRGIYTNTTQVDAYRGAGRPEAIFVVERLMGHSAKVLGQDPIALRRKSFIPRDAFPYKAASGEIYDVGDFDRVLDRAVLEADIAGFAARKAESAARGKLRGLGLSFYIESILGDQTEHTRIEFAADGYVNLYVGTQSNGQGHETVFAQILHERTGIPFDKVRFIQGDSDLIATGGGTGGSRSVTMQGNSINTTADEMISRLRPLAEEELEAAAADIMFEDGAFSIAGTDRSITLMDLAARARTMSRDDLLGHAGTKTVPDRSFPNGAHFAELEIDPETGVTQCVKYTVVDDLGVLMNPMLAEGQVHGGVAQGLGQAITERVVFDEDGQLLTGSFMDYGMPRADDVPPIDFFTELVPSTANEIGMKGCGEAGTVGALAAIANAALDAVWDEGVQRIDIPLTPQYVWDILQRAKMDAA